LQTVFRSPKPILRAKVWRQGRFFSRQKKRQPNLTLPAAASLTTPKGSAGDWNRRVLATPQPRLAVLALIDAGYAAARDIGLFQRERHPHFGN
jgi:hypothetical protein